MKNVIGGFCAGFGFCWGAMVAVGMAMVLARLTGQALGISL